MTLILLIDDDPLIADVVAATLKADGYMVGVLSDGRRAVEVIALKQPALVLLDCLMPLMPGIEVLRTIRASDRCFDVPVLMLTARAGAADQEIAIRRGANGYIVKPFTADQLSAAVYRQIEDHRARLRLANSQRLSAGRC